MLYNLVIIEKPTHVHFIVTGNNSKENASKYLDDVHNLCVTKNYYKILIEEHLEGPRLSIVDLISIIDKKSFNAIGFYKAIAYVDVNAVNDSMRIVETVAVNRSLPVQVFPSIEKAEKWFADMNR